MKEIARFSKATGNNGGLCDRTLIIYEGRKGNLKGELWASTFKGWKSKPNEPISVAWFYAKDCDATIYRVKEYFGFLEGNVYQNIDRKVIDWCNDDYNDAYTPIDNLVVNMSKYLTPKEYNNIFEKLYEGMLKDGVLR